MCDGRVEVTLDLGRLLRPGDPEPAGRTERRLQSGEAVLELGPARREEDDHAGTGLRVELLRERRGRVVLLRHASDEVGERGEQAVERVKALTGGFGVHSVLECVGLDRSMQTAIEITRPGGAVGRVGVPQDEHMAASQTAFYGNVTVSGGPAPARAYIEELLPDILEGRIEPGRVLDRVVPLEETPDGYRAMDSREAIKVMIKP